MKGGDLIMGKGKKKKVVKESGKQAEKKNSGAEVKKPKPEKISTEEIVPLKKSVEEAKANLDKAQAEANELQQKAQGLIAEAKNSYRDALVPYRDACKKAGVECEFSSARLGNVSERASFLLEKVSDGIKVTIKGRPETGELITAKALKESINKAAYGYTDKHLGSKEEIGNKGGGLSNRLRTLWNS